ncbi:MAG: CAP domain-containing protein [Candidatus Roizmanbacteria bacterium]
MIKRLLHHYFGSHEHNNFRPRILHLDFLTAYLVGAIILSIIFNSTGFKSGDILGFSTDITVSKLFSLTNGERTKAGLSQLKYNTKLAQAAHAKAEDMFAQNYWAHYAPNGKTPWDFILNSGYQYEYAGENLAKNFLFSQGVVEAWMQSPSHKENLLRKEYTEVGFAVVNGMINDEPTTLVVQMFGKPAPGALADSSSSDVVPALVPEIVTKPVAEKHVQTPAVLAQDKGPVFNLLPSYININMMFIIMLIVTLGIDAYVITKLKFIRIGGKHMAHMIFLAFILSGLLIILKGSVL